MKKIFDIKNIQGFLLKRPKKQRIIIYCAAAVLFLAMLERLVIAPISNKMRSINEEIKNKEDTIIKDLRIVSQKDSILAEKAKYRSFLQSAKTYEEEITLILKELEGLANKSSVYLVDMKPMGVKDGSLFQFLSIFFFFYGDTFEPNLPGASKPVFSRTIPLFIFLPGELRRIIARRWLSTYRF